MAKPPQNGPNIEEKVSISDDFPRAPRRKNPDAQKPPPHSSDTVGGYVAGLPTKWKAKVRARFLERGGKDGRLNKAGRELLADCIWEMACQAEAMRTKEGTVDLLFGKMNDLYDSLGISEIPKWAAGQETEKGET